MYMCAYISIIIVIIKKVKTKQKNKIITEKEIYTKK